MGICRLVSLTLSGYAPFVCVSGQGPPAAFLSKDTCADGAGFQGAPLELRIHQRNTSWPLARKIKTLARCAC